MENFKIGWHYQKSRNNQGKNIKQKLQNKQREGRERREM